MVGKRAAAIMRAEHGLSVGGAADIVVLDAADQRSAIRTVASPLAGWKAGRKTFVRPKAHILEHGGLAGR